MKESVIKDLIINIRPMETGDVEAASQIEEEAFSMPWKASDFLEMVEADYAYYFVALLRENRQWDDMDNISNNNNDDYIESKEKIVGIIGLRDIAGEGEITNVAVKTQYRGLGIGRKLLEKAVDQCSQLNIADITLEVRASNIPAIRLYESLGFKGEGYRPKFYEHPTEDALIMWKRSLL